LIVFIKFYISLKLFSTLLVYIKVDVTYILYFLILLLLFLLLLMLTQSNLYNSR